MAGKKQDAPKYISGADFARYAQAKEINAKCLRCGASSWHLHDTGDMVGIAGMIVEAGGSLDKRYIPLILLSCENCGSTWTVNRGFVRDWIDANPATNTPKEEGPSE